jgi:hypothetical protein
VPAFEESPTFTGFSASEINLVTDDPSCGGGTCLVNGFQGLTTCPYGQDANGRSPSPSVPACTTPGTGQPVTSSGPGGATVQPQCTDRRPSSTVYCTCRCANADGQTDDGADYCSCPDGFTCTQLVSSLGSANIPLAGAYCIKGGTAYDPATACARTCDPIQQNCP